MTPTDVTYELRTVAHLVRPWGEPARDLEQLRAGIAAAPDDVIFWHAVQYPLRHPAAAELTPDDWSAWVATAVQDVETAERLSFALQARYESAAPVRAAALAVLEAACARRHGGRTAPPGAEFVFLAADSLAYPVGRVVTDAHGALAALAEEEAGVWFLHLVEEPWRSGGSSLLAWLEASGAARAAGWLREAAAAGLPIDRARAQAVSRSRRSSIARRMAAAAGTPDDERRETGRQALARLVRRGRAGNGA